MTITLPEIIEIDMPMIIVMVVLWLLGFLKDKAR